MSVTITHVDVLPKSVAAAIAVPSRGYTTLAWHELDEYTYFAGALEDIVRCEGDMWDEITIFDNGTVEFFYLADADAE